jgi:hypothetical protein
VNGAAFDQVAATGRPLAGLGFAYSGAGGSNSMP